MPIHDGWTTECSLSSREIYFFQPEDREKINSKAVALPLSWPKKSGIPTSTSKSKISWDYLSPSLSVGRTKSSQSEMKSRLPLPREIPRLQTILSGLVGLHFMAFSYSGHSTTLMSHFRFPNGSCLVGSIYSSSRPHVCCCARKSQKCSFFSVFLLFFILNTCARTAYSLKSWWNRPGCLVGCRAPWSCTSVARKTFACATINDHIVKLSHHGSKTMLSLLFWPCHLFCQSGLVRVELVPIIWFCAS